MARIIKQLKHSRQVVFDKGSFDNWCVFVVEENGKRKAPLDTEYFTDLQNISKKYKADKVYTDFVLIYDKTSVAINNSVLDLIDQIVETYRDEDKIIIEQWFSVIYGGMIAEENKQNAILKKRVKRLGIYQILKLNYPPQIAANYSRGKKWRELDSTMKSYGF